MKKIAILTFILLFQFSTDYLKAEDSSDKYVQVSSLDIRSVEMLSPTEIKFRFSGLNYELPNLDGDFHNVSDHSDKNSEIISFFTGVTNGGISLVIFGLGMPGPVMFGMIAGSAVISAALFPDNAKRSAISGGFGVLCTFVLYVSTFLLRGAFAFGV